MPHPSHRKPSWGESWSVRERSKKRLPKIESLVGYGIGSVSLSLHASTDMAAHFLSPMYHHLSLFSSRLERGPGPSPSSSSSSSAVQTSASAITSRSSLGIRRRHHPHPHYPSVSRRREGRRLSSAHHRQEDDNDDDNNHSNNNNPYQQWQVWAVRARQNKLLLRFKEGGDAAAVELTSLEDGSAIDPAVLRHMRIDPKDVREGTSDCGDRSGEDGTTTTMAAAASSRLRVSPRKVGAAVHGGGGASADEGGRRDRRR
jgi:hypothetical protein